MVVTHMKKKKTWTLLFRELVLISMGVIKSNPIILWRFEFEIPK
jgi:hypothetical protein